MINIHSVAGRIALGKFIGLFVGLICVFALPTFGYPVISMLGLGTLLMFVLMGVMIGFVGQYDRHPMFDFKMPWWFRGPLIGVMFMLMFVLFNYNDIEIILQSSLVSWMGLESPFWALLDGIFIGGIMGWIETYFAGEGSELPLT